MKITLDRLNDDYLFEVTNAEGQKLRMDNNSNGAAEGVSPMETLLSALVGCSSIDIVSILKKQKQEISGFHAEVDAERRQMKDAKPFKHIHVNYKLEGEIDPKKAIRAANLSFDKYCSVSMSLDPEIDVTWDITLNDIMLDID